MEGSKQMKVNSAFFLKNISAVLFLKLISNLKIIKNEAMCTLYNLIYENDSSKSYFKPNFQYMEVVHEHESIFEYSH